MQSKSGGPPDDITRMKFSIPNPQLILDMPGRQLNG